MKKNKESINRNLIGLALFSTGFISCSKSEQPLNVIYIMSDDHTSQAIGVYGSRLASLDPTPTIDQLAQEGTLLENCFCTNSISTPSRSSIMTGQYAHRNGVLTLDEKLKSNQQYLPDEFRSLGYQTAVIGKWHLGCEPSGFDYYSVLTGYGGQGSYFDPIFQSSEAEANSWPENTRQYKGHSTDIITDITIEWLKNKRDKNKPFFLMHHYKAPHDDFEFAPRYAKYLENTEIPVPKSLFDTHNWGSEATRGSNDSLRHIIGTSVSGRNEKRSYVEMYKMDTSDSYQDTYLAYQEYLKRYLRCVKGIDDNLKRLFDYLKEEGMWENTIIVYTGDQGMMLGEHDLQDKRWMYEESMRMPFIVRHPKSKQKGEKTDLLIDNTDFAPTLLELAGGTSPQYMDGQSFAAVFDDKIPLNPRQAIYYRYWMHLIHHNVPAHFGIRTKEYKLIFYYGRHYNPTRYGDPSMAWLKKESHKIAPTPVAFELYNIKNDPLEMTNLAENPEYAEVLEKLKKQLIKLKAEVGDDDSQYPEIQGIINEYF